MGCPHVIQRFRSEGDTLSSRGHIGIMEKKMETMIMGLYRDVIGVELG